MSIYLLTYLPTTLTPLILLTPTAKSTHTSLVLPSPSPTTTMTPPTTTLQNTSNHIIHHTHVKKAREKSLFNTTTAAATAATTATATATTATSAKNGPTERRSNPVHGGVFVPSRDCKGRGKDKKRKKEKGEEKKKKKGGMAENNK
ncbi:hypothetical protein IWX90DRAFT_77462 [Phyllosticta citrichinensis]|uniref:Uncharacterized protein n=1 Tax=Phyllosticta citrichinensis TaxID=1130410 RepID=A0ABR1XGX4_9PEZI